MIDHSGHPHPSTPKARALCRANGGTGSIAKPGVLAPEASKRAKAVPKTTPPKISRGPHLMEPKVPVVKLAPRTIGHTPPSRAAGTKVTGITVKAARKSGIGAKLERTDEDRRVADRRKAEQDARLARIKQRATVEVPASDNIAKSFNSGVVSSETLSGGAIAITTKVKFKDGNTGVQKIIEDLPDDVMRDIPPKTRKYLPSAKVQQDREELGSMVARALGLNAPEVYRVNETTTVQEFKNGKVGQSVSMADRRRLFESDQATVIAVMDQIIGNDDRNLGNWLSDGNEIVPIDFSGSWGGSAVYDTPDGEPLKRATDEFQRILRDPRTGDFKPNRLSSGDMDRIESIFTALKPEFKKREQLAEWEWSMKRISGLRPYAQGTEQKIK